MTKNDGFYLTMGMFFVLFVCILFGVCGADLVRGNSMFDKVILRIINGFVLLIFLSLFICGCKIYFSDFGVIRDFTFVSDMKNNKKYTSLIFDKNIQEAKRYKYLEKVIFYSDELHINSKAFSNCKNLKEITLYENPKEIAKDAFLGCENLSLIRFYGTKEDWEKHKIFIPSNPKIEFLSIHNEDKKKENPKTNIECNGTITIIQNK